MLTHPPPHTWVRNRSSNPRPSRTPAVNGTTEQKLDRLAIRELCEGWPTHRDAQEWEKFRELFTDTVS